MPSSKASCQFLQKYYQVHTLFTMVTMAMTLWMCNPCRPFILMELPSSISCPNFSKKPPAQAFLQNDSSDGKESDAFQAPSPISVLDSSSSCSVEKSMSITLEKVIPVGHRSKRPRASTSNPWVVMLPISSAPASKNLKRNVRKKKLSQLSGSIAMQQNSFQPVKEKLEHIFNATGR